MSINQSLQSEISDLKHQADGTQSVFDVHIMPSKFLDYKKILNSTNLKNQTNQQVRNLDLKKNIIWGVAVVAVLGILMLLAGWLFLKSINQPVAIIAPAPTNSSAPTDSQPSLVEILEPTATTTLESPDTTTNQWPALEAWSVYTDPLYRFKLKYPAQVLELQANPPALFHWVKNSTDSGNNLKDFEINFSLTTEKCPQLADQQNPEQIIDHFTWANAQGSFYQTALNDGGTIYYCLEEKQQPIFLITRRFVTPSSTLVGYLSPEQQTDLFNQLMATFSLVSLAPELLDNQAPEFAFKEPPLSSPDADQDGLTDLEETLYSTNPNLPDTDQDGYADGSELKGLYSPLKATEKLVDSLLVKTYQNDRFGYLLFYPSTWSQAELDESGETVMFTSETAEFIEVIVQENLTGIDNIRTWYLGQVEGIDPSQVANFSISGTLGVISPDGLNVYLMHQNRIYILSYNINLKEQANFTTTFSMLLSSFKLFDNPLE